MSFGERFLANPDLFPARIAGARLGPGRAAIDLPGGRILVRGLGKTQRDWIEARFGSLVRPSSTETNELSTLDVFRAPASDFLAVDLEGREYEFDLDVHERRLLLAGPGFMGRIEPSPRLRGGLWVDPDARGWVFPSAFDNMLRVATCHMTLQRGGAVLHSAAVTDGVEGWIFLGRSGIGKSTLARAAREAGWTVLSDDLNSLTLDEHRGPRIARVPFAGDLGQDDPSPLESRLAGIVRLEQGPELSVDSLSPGRSVATLVACAPYLNRDRWRLPRLERLLEEVERVVPTLRLRTPRGHSFPETIAALRGRAGSSSGGSDRQ